jgi:hypothetical protein
VDNHPVADGEEIVIVFFCSSDGIILWHTNREVKRLMNVIVVPSYCIEISSVRNEDSTMRLSYKERMVDALAPEVDERRGKRRYAPGRCKQPLIRGFLNGETPYGDKP